MRLRVAGVQMAVTGDIGENSRTILEAIDAAASAKADILLTPEGSLSGYTHQFDRRYVADALERVVAAARRRNLGLALGTCQFEADGRCYDELRFYQADGTFLGLHAKVLLCGTMAVPPVGEINHYATFPIRSFSWDGLRVGGLICNDLWANPEWTPMPDPHLVQQLAGQGVRVIFHAVNGGRDGTEWTRLTWTYHEANLRMRARAAATWIVTVDSSHPLSLPCSSPSGVIAPDGSWVCRVEPQGHQFFVQTIDLDEPIGAAHR